MSIYPLARSARLLFVLMALIATILAGCGGGGGDNGGGDTDDPPVIVTQPQSLTVDAGDNATFTVGATGDSLAYQWQRLNTGTWENLATAANANAYTIASADAGDAGSYRVVVSNPDGTATSNAATLTVSTPGTGGGTVIVD